MSKFDPRSAKILIFDMLKYDAVQDTDGVICKDMGDYLQMLVPMKNAKGHDTYEIYYNDSGRISHVKGHRGNSGFSDTKYY